MALNWLKGKFNEVSKSLKGEVTKIRNQTFLEGVVAGCALVAYADGIVKPEEKQKMMGFMRNNDIMSVFKTEDIIKLFEKFSSRFEFDRQIGEIDAFAAIAKVKSKPDQARLLVRVCCAIASSDGDFDEQEKQAVRKVCNELGLDPADFDL
ncbi:tellurite resistance TerB family protein [Nitrococcus mobilis]|uniref:Tellurite resistance TerB n=1 Tax=Nitrococcus mobilis Nb-231 TaxID=314278 RepID=A4BT09_9GAMM|nr:tellurite resistance TerB family protein [Nitrococcus mobilis]EAR21077.1 Tellurite resistance TerB [Nitrococcus mobilis Nb-231]